VRFEGYTLWEIKSPFGARCWRCLGMPSDLTAALGLTVVNRFIEGGFEIAVGTVVADCPPRGPGRAHRSASGSYLG
jgi:hypothetical protein